MVQSRIPKFSLGKPFFGLPRNLGIRFAPLYDAVTTRVFPGLAGDRMALKLNGKDDRLTPQDFITLARTIDVPISRAKAIMSETAAQISHASPDLALPAFARGGKANTAEDSVRDIALARIEQFR
jgi:serine/threonine-protein kinase HipA